VSGPRSDAALDEEGFRYRDVAQAPLVA
jgi:hypothetical protein